MSKFYSSVVLSVFFIFVSSSVYSQTTRKIKGSITDYLGDPIENAEVYLLLNGEEKGYIITEFEGLFEFEITESGIYELYIERDLITKSKFVNITDDKITTNVTIVFEGESFNLSTQEIKGQRRNDLRLYAGSIENTKTASLLDLDEATPVRLGLYNYTFGGKSIVSQNLGLRGVHPKKSRFVHHGFNGSASGYPIFQKEYNTFSLANTDVEIIKASASTEYAPYNTAGVINEICCGIEDTLLTSLEGAFSSTLSGDFSATHSGWGNDNLKGLVSLNLSGGNTYHEDLPFYKVNGLAKISYTPNPEHKLDIIVNSTLSKENTLTGHTSYSGNEDPFSNFKYEDELSEKTVSLGANYKKIFSEKLVSNTKISLGVSEYDWNQERDVFVEESVYNDKGYTNGSEIALSDVVAYADLDEDENYLRVGDGEHQIKYDHTYLNASVEQEYLVYLMLFNKDQRLRIGGRVYLEELEKKVSFGELNADNSGFTDDQGNRGVHLDIETPSVSLYAQHQVSFGKLVLLPGIRMDYNDHRIVDNLDDNKQFKKTTTQFLPGIGWNYNWNQYAVYGGVHTGYQPYSSTSIQVPINQSTNWDVSDVRSVTGELGGRGYSDKISFDVGVFGSHYTGLEYDNGASLFTEPVNSMVAGAEISCDIDLEKFIENEYLPTVAIDYHYTYSNILEGVSGVSEFYESAQELSGNQLPYAPQHMVSLQVSKKLPTLPLTALVGVEYTSEVFTDYQNTKEEDVSGALGKTDAFIDLKLRVNYEYENWTFFLVGDNLLMQEYINARNINYSGGYNPQQSGAFYGNPLEVKVGAKLNLYHTRKER